MSQINLKNILSVTDFQRNPKAVLGRLRETRSPVVLTVNGKAEMVIQDAESYQDLLDRVRAAEDLAAIREGLAQSFTEDGENASEFFATFKQQHGV